MYVNLRSDPHLARIAEAAFGRNLPREAQIRPFRPMSTPSFWSGGSRDYWAIVDTATMRAIRIEENGSGFTPYDERGGIGISSLPGGCILVQLTKSGSREYLYFYGELAPILPAPSADLTDDEKTVLRVSKEYKGGFRRQYARLDAAAYDAALESLKAKKLLTGNGAITTEGKNIVQAMRGY